MKRTSAVTVVVLVFAGAVLGGLAQLALATSGRPIFAPPFTLPVALAAIGVIVVVMAVPIRRMTRGGTTAPVDPFYAARVVTLAKASALSGSVGVGAGIGFVLYLLSRAVSPALTTVAPAVATLVGAAVLLAGALIAEAMCRVPPRDDDRDDSDGPVRARS
ncbi:DUF3180 domain-containing protein [Marisediminicola sp. LYQ85]|uniref:DUF3180 domain-containing protein n=1 Tax=Marisediminicola sp. LYQ85 TaxID=3391062 RepID=UPI003983130F